MTSDEHNYIVTQPIKGNRKKVICEWRGRLLSALPDAYGRFSNIVLLRHGAAEEVAAAVRATSALPVTVERIDELTAPTYGAHTYRRRNTTKKYRGHA